MIMKRINGNHFDNLMNVYKISNKIMSEYLQCHRTTIIHRRQDGIFDFSDEQYRKLERLFSYGDSFDFNKFLDSLTKSDFVPKEEHIGYVKESLIIHRKLQEYEDYLLSYRLIKNFDSPQVMLPNNREKHLRILNILMDQTSNVEKLNSIIDSPSRYFMTSEKFLSNFLDIKNAFILSVNINYMKELYPKLKKLDVNKVTEFHLLPVRISDDPMVNIDELYNSQYSSTEGVTSIRRFMDPKLTGVQNELMDMMKTECKLVDFVQKLSEFSKLLKAPIIMFLNEEDDEFDYIVKSLDSINRKKFLRIDIYKLNNMFGKRGNLYLSLEDALKLYNIQFDSKELIINPKYKNVAINTLINKLMLKYGGGSEAAHRDRMNATVHITYRELTDDKLSSQWTTFKKIKRNSVSKAEHLITKEKGGRKERIVSSYIDTFRKEEEKEKEELISNRKLMSKKGGKING
jgi:hypothetical protein